MSKLDPIPISGAPRYPAGRVKVLVLGRLCGRRMIGLIYSWRSLEVVIVAGNQNKRQLHLLHGSPEAPVTSPPVCHAGASPGKKGPTLPCITFHFRPPGGHGSPNSRLSFFSLFQNKESLCVTRSGDYFIRAPWSLITFLLLKSQTLRQDNPQGKMRYD